MKGGKDVVEQVFDAEAAKVAVSRCGQVGTVRTIAIPTDSFIAKWGRKHIRAAFNWIMRTELTGENSLWFRSALAQVLSGGQPSISDEDVGFVLGTLFVEQFCFRLSTTRGSFFSRNTGAPPMTLLRGAVFQAMVKKPSMARRHGYWKAKTFLGALRLD